MKIEKYTEQAKRLPKTGRQIIGSIDKENVIVYQAFNSNIARYAVTNQRFGGSHYSFNRMSWIKPGFLWMMHRAGWASKEDQHKILAIHLPVIHFKHILGEATISSYNSDLFQTKEIWSEEIKRTEVRLQWDPDHDPWGNKQERKAIQIGMKGKILEKFCTEWIVKIEDITDFATSQYQHVAANKTDDLMVPYEEVLALNDIEIENRIGITKLREHEN
ncbi:MAG: DUF4291 domain-containing protein [Bacteroidota bacterium]